jgi:hypothetical protein
MDYQWNFNFNLILLSVREILASVFELKFWSAWWQNFNTMIWHLTYQEKNRAQNKFNFKKWCKSLEPDIYKILKPMISLIYHVIICTYTAFQSFFARRNVEWLKKFLCYFFTDSSKAQKAWLKTKKENFFYTYFAIFY